MAFSTDQPNANENGAMLKKCPSCGADLLWTFESPAIVLDAEGNRILHYKCGSVLCRCDHCGRTICLKCSKQIDEELNGIRARRSFTYSLVILILGVPFGAWCLWTVLASEGGPRSPQTVGIYSAEAFCDDKFNNSDPPYYLNADAVRELDGCAGWLPPPPSLLPGYDQDCSDILNIPVRVTNDLYGLDRDGDGIGCEPGE